MSRRALSTSPLPTGRTGHACVQCRRRKQKCGGFTYGIKCRPCTTRKVKCSFEEEINDPRHNPYLRLRTSKSPSVGIEKPINDINSFPSAILDPSLSAVGEDQPQPSIPTLVNGGSLPTTDDNLRGQIESLKSRLSELESRIVTTDNDRPRSTTTPQSQMGSHTSLLQFDTAPPHPNYQSPAPAISLGSLTNSDTRSLSSPQNAVVTDGPLKTLNTFQPDDPIQSELHDPILCSVITEGEAHVIFRLFFSKCHPNTPFLDTEQDSNVDYVRANSILLFLSILCAGARSWGASAKASCWLHPRYPELVKLLDAEVMRVTLRPGPDDQKLETVQALLICAHWMPFDISADRKRYRSRFSEGGAWQCLGLAIRWSTSLALERSCHLSFQTPDTVSREDIQRFRTMLYLTESDHYLALSARRPSHLDPSPLNGVLNEFLQSKFVQDTDIRLASLFRVAYGAHFSGFRPTTTESVEAFDMDVQLIERQFTSSFGDRSVDSLRQHFPFISLCWYRLSFACAFLDAADPSQRGGKALTWAIEWASQILVHLSSPPSAGADGKGTAIALAGQLEPDPSVVHIMSFAIDHYYVVIVYAAFFLVNSWLSNLTDLNLSPHIHMSQDTSWDGSVSTSLLYRLVDLAARTLEAASPPEGHLARRYIPLLRGMIGTIASSRPQPLGPNVNENGSNLPDDSSLPGQIQGNLGEDLWEMWQQAGLEPLNWPSLLEDICEQESEQ